MSEPIRKNNLSEDRVALIALTSAVADIVESLRKKGLIDTDENIKSIDSMVRVIEERFENGGVALEILAFIKEDGYGQK